ncbi:speckle-type POZ protein homolog [Chironomus tepperi]|uniref:speckle-type POZ protein homolog n=1 Tax=Chironomus tepperi TaxID=113505 RepID=UPI00391F8A5C
MDLFGNVVHDVEWKINNVSRELEEARFTNSPPFDIISDERVSTWFIRLWHYKKHFGVFLYSVRTDVKWYTVKFDVFIRTVNGKKENSRKFSSDYSTHKSWGWRFYIQTENFFKCSDQYLNNGTLTIGARIKIVKKEPVDNDEDRCRHLAMNKECFKTKLYSDLTFVCSDNFEIKGHRTIIAPASSIFKKMIDEEPSGIIKIDDINGQYMMEIFRFIYTKTVNDIKEFAQKLIYGAERLELDDLKELCVRTMIRGVSAENVVDYFLFADEKGIGNLKEHCIWYIKDKNMPVDDQENWKKLEKYHQEILNHKFLDTPFTRLVSSF